MSEKTKAVEYCDLLKATWLNFKNSEETLLHNLRNSQDLAIQESMNILHKDLLDVDCVNMDIENFLSNYDMEIMEINHMLEKNKAPNNIVNTEKFTMKFDWYRSQLERDCITLKKSIEDLEDKNALLLHEYQEVHSELRSCSSRMQPLSDEKNHLVNKIESLQTTNEMLQSKLLASEEQQLQMNLNIENQKKEISLLKKDFEEMETSLRNTILEIELKNKVFIEELIAERKKNKDLFANIHDMQTKQDFPKQDLIKSDSDMPIFTTNSKNSCSECPKHLNKIRKLIEDLEEINERYSMKREKHKQKLTEARSTFMEKTKQLNEQINFQTETTNDLSEKLRNLQIRLQTSNNEKNLLSKRILPLENDLVHSTNNNIIYQEKIKKLENQLEKLTKNVYEKMLHIEN